jgi:signal peptidase I
VVFKSVEGGELPPERNPVFRLVDRLRGEQGPPPREDLIKRVVAVSGDEVVVKDGTLLVNGEPQKEPYVNSKFPDRSTSAPVTVPKDHIFAMGDNRANSRDSRVFGPVPYENIEGQAFVRFWPVDRLGLL